MGRDARRREPFRLSFRSSASIDRSKGEKWTKVIDLACPPSAFSVAILSKIISNPVTSSYSARGGGKKFPVTSWRENRASRPASIAFPSVPSKRYSSFLFLEKRRGFNIVAQGGLARWRVPIDNGPRVIVLTLDPSSTKSSEPISPHNRALHRVLTVLRVPVRIPNRTSPLARERDSSERLPASGGHLGCPGSQSAQ